MNRPDPHEAAQVFLTVVTHAAHGNGTAAANTLIDYMAVDNDLSHLRTWGFASCGPYVAGHLIRKTIPVSGNGLYALDMLPAAEHDDPTTVAMMRAAIEHANHPNGAGNDAALDIFIAHERTHGPQAAIAFVLEALKFCAYLWRETENA